MLKFRIRLLDGTYKTMPPAVTVVYNSEQGVPADDITVTFPYCGGFSESIDYIYAYDSGEVVFCGQADEIIASKSSDGVILKITARSLAALLLDNEAEPRVYYTPAPSLIYKNHLQPYGFENTVTSDEPYFGTVNVTKGMSEWEVLENFCFDKYNSVPRITGSGRVIFKNEWDGGVISFSDTGGNRYISIKKSLNRCSVISEVRLRLSEESRYNSKITNGEADSGIVRRRLVNALTDTNSIETADEIISEGNNEYFEAEIECPGRYLDLVGRSAEIADSRFGKIDSMYIHKIKYTLGESGEKSVITLRKEN